MFHICQGLNKLIKFDQCHLNRLPELGLPKVDNLVIDSQNDHYTYQGLNSSQIRLLHTLSVTVSYLEKLPNPI